MNYTFSIGKHLFTALRPSDSEATEFVAKTTLFSDDVKISADDVADLFRLATSKTAITEKKLDKLTKKRPFVRRAVILATATILGVTPEILARLFIQLSAK